MVSVEEWLADIALMAARVPTPKPADARRKFRASMQWRRVRYSVLADNKRKHGGKIICELCGVECGPDKPGGVAHCDHIRPISTPEGWAKRFDRSLLRVTCADCNTGRLASPIELEGWRPDEDAQQVDTVT